MNEHGVVLSDIKITFQPTPPHGDEPEEALIDLSTATFQPTPPYGDECDIIEFNKTIFTISTHIPAGGWTNFKIVECSDPHYNPHPCIGMNETIW